MTAVAVEKIRARDVRVGDRISFDGFGTPAFTVLSVEGGHKILRFIDAVRITARNDAGGLVAQNFGLRKPMRRAR